MQLRAYQQKLIDDIKKELRQGSKSVCAILPCGGGKSIIQGMIAKGATDKGNNVLFLVHRKELCEQIKATFKLCGVNLNLCQIAMVQTVTRRLTKTVKPQIIITDEAHHCLSQSYINIYDYFNTAIKLGFTATPIRMNEGGLGKVFDKLITSVTTQWLIDNHYLSPNEYYSVKLINTEDVHIKRGDFDAREVAELVEKKYLYGETLKNYLKLAKGKKTIIYCATIEQSKKTIEEFNNNNIKAKHVDAKTPPAERERIVNQFKNNEISILSNVDLFGEGFDVPDCECVILLRPTKSLTLYIQQSMRSMRYKEGKTAIIIDHVGNVYEHGLPEEEREWSLKAKKKSKQEEKIKIKECPKCFKVLPGNIEKCKYCGFVFEKEKAEVTEREVIDTKLEKITKAEILASKPMSFSKTFTTFEQMQEFRQIKNFKFPWELHQCAAMNIPVPQKYMSVARRLNINVRERLTESN